MKYYAQLIPKGSRTFKYENNGLISNKWIIGALSDQIYPFLFNFMWNSSFFSKPHTLNFNTLMNKIYLTKKVHKEIEKSHPKMGAKALTNLLSIIGTRFVGFLLF